ncbi:N-acetylglutamate synthase-like GNAT family acetyltransferase [Caldalkalibacillus uzonensis]|uniref:N-acetylglutamate synthase-like GNAT family acetyltransferase n=1 Tax=Caldalkalibacillus uzonensis TaxID=353224 RepID=A0ABU0CTJ7_9BACI|nr:GNAT family N-acetyltransferase [Caldalkalibacillus uzonensis]MDQ0339744.1 N-acetylglutamate synthase-like GNAT family acetyltransferase [Caldalkalibacillus uzonensis]
MGWYQKLRQYFPPEEMKKKEQMEALLKQNPHYKKEETDSYIMLYGEYSDFIFVDYILVDKEKRGQGIGQRLLEELKAKGKTIILEVEPVDEDDPDTVKRERFYLSNGFKRTEHIRYYRDVGETSPELNRMELYYWSPQGEVDEEVIREQMVKAYEDIHHYQYEEYFDRWEPDPEKLIQYTPDAPEQQVHYLEQGDDHDPDQPQV